MLKAAHREDPVVLSYLALRKAVGIVAVGLPSALAIPWWFFQHHSIESSISGYYYTGMRNVFVGSLCAISVFMLCCRGYDLKDEIAGTFSGICALGVAFFPTAPQCATAHQKHVGWIHYGFAALLFSTLAIFCFVLFRMTVAAERPTRKKLQRNRVYTVCGCVIVASMILIPLMQALHVQHVGVFGPTFCFETTALLGFGVAWLVKGEFFLKDEEPTHRRTIHETKG